MINIFMQLSSDENKIKIL